MRPFLLFALFSDSRAVAEIMPAGKIPPGLANIPGGKEFPATSIAPVFLGEHYSRNSVYFIL